MSNQRTERIRQLSPLDRFLSVLGRGMADAVTTPVAVRPNPADGAPEAALTESSAMAEATTLDATSRRHAGGLMRVNHVGEVCAQALYEGHALTVGDDDLSVFFLAAAEEERDHLAWTAQRLRELQARPSVLLPLWYVGSLSLGAIAGLGGRKRALGFMAETERQVEAHLQGHLDRLPQEDHRSRAIVEQMKADEARHADQAGARGGEALPAPVVAAMRFMSRIMTTIAYRL